MDRTMPPGKSDREKTEEQTVTDSSPVAEDSCPTWLQLGDTPTQTIDLGSLLTKDVTSSGSFDLRSGILATTFGKLMQEGARIGRQAATGPGDLPALPLPSQGLDWMPAPTAFDVVDAGEDWRP